MLNVRAKRLKCCRWRTTKMMGGKPLRISTDETSSSSQSRIFCQPPLVRGREKESRRRRRRRKGTRRVLVSQVSGLSGHWSQAGEQKANLIYNFKVHQFFFRASGVNASHYPPYPPLLSSLYNLTLPSLPDNRSLVEQSLVQRLSGLSSLHPSRHPFLSLQRPPTVGGDKGDMIRVSDNKEDDQDDDDDDDDEKRKKKKTRTVFSRSQVSYPLRFRLSFLNPVSDKGFPIGVDI